MKAFLQKFLQGAAALLAIAAGSGAALAKSQSAGAPAGAENAYLCFTECGKMPGLIGQIFIAGILAYNRASPEEALPRCVLYGIPGKSAIPEAAPAAENQIITIQRREVEDDLIFDDVTTTSEQRTKKTMPFAVQPQILFEVLLHEKHVFEALAEAYREQGICKTVTDLSRESESES